MNKIIKDVQYKQLFSYISIFSDNFYKITKLSTTKDVLR